MKDQQKILRAARKRLGINTEELATRLGKSLPALRSWLLPDDNAAHRDMPRSAKLLLDTILEADKAGGGSGNRRIRRA